MTPIERQILLNQIAIMESLFSIAAAGPGGTREILRQRYRETAELIRLKSSNPQR